MNLFSFFWTILSVDTEDETQAVNIRAGGSGRASRAIARPIILADDPVKGRQPY